MMDGSSGLQGQAEAERGGEPCVRGSGLLPSPCGQGGAPGARGARSPRVLAIISASWEILLQLKLLTIAGRSLSTRI